MEGGCVATVPAEIRHPPPPVAVPSANLVPRSPEIPNTIANPFRSANFCTLLHSCGVKMQIHTWILIRCVQSSQLEDRRNIECIFGPHFFAK